jgi:hypothetical protein
MIFFGGNDIHLPIGESKAAGGGISLEASAKFSPSSIEEIEVSIDIL